MAPVAWKISFYRDLETGEKPCREWLDELAEDDPDKRLAALAAIERVLAKQGINVCEGEWGKNLGRGLYEFRIRHPATTIEAMFQPKEAPARKAAGKPRILLRIFFTTYGKHVILLCSGYDKGTNPGKGFQSQQIKAARAMVAKAQAGLAARLKSEAAAGKQ